MPRGHKSKLRAQAKRRQARSENQAAQEAQAPGAQGGEAPSCCGLSGEAASSSSVGLVPQKSQGASPPASATGVATPKMSARGAKNRGREREPSPVATVPTKSSEKELLMKKAGMLMHYLLYKYQMKEKAVKSEMMKIVHKRFRPKFPEILQMTTEWAEMLFGLELKEVKPGGGCYTFVRRFTESNYGNLITSLDIPMNGVLIPVPNIIILSGNCVPEEEILEFLNMMPMYNEKEYLICGELQNITTKDLVPNNYLMYRQVLLSDPPNNEFLSGPRAFNETNKMKVLELLAKVNETIPTAFPWNYAEALREEEGRAQATAAVSRGAVVLSLPSPGETSNIMP
ncbi:melanoma-associated antigen B2-like [Octodon degus]|uniref:Melanoma-associated antigen B2-like n=1 Tax=Octodon degus TaxID=10160 RepID=A0A6P3F6G0_OCTDE|nr:melanoma-associated antigen B2-like [Octodon degus]